MRRLSRERRDEIVRLYAAGESALSISEKLWREWGYASRPSLTTSVYRVLRQEGVQRRNQAEAGALALKTGRLVIAVGEATKNT